MHFVDARASGPLVAPQRHTAAPQSYCVPTPSPSSSHLTITPTDKTRFAVDGLKRQRLDKPMLRTPGGALEPVSWSQALSVAAHQLSNAPKGTVGALAGSLVEVEALVCAKDLLNSVGSCATSGTGGAISADLRGGYVFGATIAGVEEADAILLVGTNPRVEAPLVNARIRKMVRHASLPVASVGPAADLTYEYDHLGGGADALSALLDGSSPFSAALKGANKPLVLVGAAALGRTDGDAIGAATRAIAAQARNNNNTHAGKTNAAQQEQRRQHHDQHHQHRRAGRLPRRRMERLFRPGLRLLRRWRARRRFRPRPVGAEISRAQGGVPAWSG